MVAGRVGKRFLKLKIDGTEYTAQVSSSKVTNAESSNDFVTFLDAANGGARDWNLELTLEQNTAAAGLWRKLWDSPGLDVEVLVMPHGNTTPTDTEPHFSGTVTMKFPDGDVLGGDADASSTATQVISVVWPFTGKPTMITG